MPVFWLNGHVVDADNAKLSVYDHGLLYGDGVFEGLRFYHNKVFRLEEHLHRLFDSAAAICLTIPFTKEELTKAVENSIEVYADDTGYIRLVITRGEGKLGVNPELCKKPNTFMIVDKLDMLSDRIKQKGARLVIATTRRLPIDGLDPRIKSLNYLNHILARIEATNAGADEAILLNAQGFVTEGSADNIFIVKNCVLLTPPVSDGVLNGITRQTVIDLAQKQNIKCIETSLSPYDLYTADECFLTGTAIELTPVSEIEGRKIQKSPGDVFLSLQTAFFDLVNGTNDDARVIK